MDTDEGVKPSSKTISCEEIVCQVCYDLGTLYFYKEDIEKAKRLFEKCAGVQVLEIVLKYCSVRICSAHITKDTLKI